MKKWFTNVAGMEELRKQYRELLKQYHPDNKNGSTEATQEINAEYDVLFATFNQETQTDGKLYAEEENEQFKVILNEIIGFNMTIEIIGSWIWCFDSFPYKDKLKELGFKFAPKKKAWCWHFEEYYRHHKKEVSLDSIRAKYGSEVIHKKKQQAVID